MVVAVDGVVFPACFLSENSPFYDPEPPPLEAAVVVPLGVLEGSRLAVLFLFVGWPSLTPLINSSSLESSIGWKKFILK